MQYKLRTAKNEDFGVNRGSISPATMRTYLSSIIPKLSQFSEKLDNSALLVSKHWVVIDDENNSKLTYIFRPNGDLLLSQSGKVQKAKWEYLGSQTLLIDKGDDSFLFKHGFFNENVLALKVDGGNEYAILVNEEMYSQGLQSAGEVNGFLESIYNGTPNQSNKLYLQYESNDLGVQVKKILAKNETESFIYFFLLPLFGAIFLLMLFL